MVFIFLAGRGPVLPFTSCPQGVPGDENRHKAEKTTGSYTF